MAGEIGEPLGLDFKADSFLSGSVSFGRFEREDLCWERRSSFSHNRYIEEVEKCSKPGSVIEKKAILEAHFRKKGVLALSSPTTWTRTDCQTTDNDEFTHANLENNQDSPELDERMDTGYLCESKHVEQVPGLSVLDAQSEYSCHSTRNFDSYSECVMVEEEEHHSNSGSLLPANPRIETCVQQVLDFDDSKSDTIHVSDHTVIDISSDKHGSEDCRDATPKGRQEKVSSHVRPRSVSGVGDTRTRRCISSKKVPKGPEKTPGNVRMRSEAEKKSTGATVDPKQKTLKHETVLKSKVPSEIKRSDKGSRNKQIENSRSSALREVSNSEDRIKRVAGAPQRCTKQDSSRFSFKCNERAERRKEFDMQLEEKTHAREAERRKILENIQQKREVEIKQLRKSLNFKATPLPAFYYGVECESDGNKSISRNGKARRAETKGSSCSSISEKLRLSSITATGMKKRKTGNTAGKTMDQKQASGATSCHSTVTSDSSPSSPAAEASKGQSRQVGGRGEREKEKEKEKVRSHKSVYKAKTRY